MKNFIFLFFIAIPSSLPCRPEGYWWGEDDKKGSKYFPPGNSWNGWNPPQGDNEWKKWIEKWGKHRTTDKPESDEWGSERGPETGWPQHWKGFGLSIQGVPPPPWAYVPESYEKPQYCFSMPRFGHCSDNVTRWGFNPTRAKCQTFFYSGCGGNENNFISEARCSSACVDTVAPDCEIDPGVNFEEMMTYEFNPPIN